MSKLKKLSVLFEKPVSLLFALVNIFPFLLFAANVFKGGKGSIFSSSLRDVAEKNDLQQAIENATQRFSEYAAEKAAELAAQQVSGQISEIASGQADQIITQQTTALATQQAAQTAAAQSAEQAAHLAAEYAAQIAAQPSAQQVIQQTAQIASAQAAEQASQNILPFVQEAIQLVAKESSKEFNEMFISKPLPAIFILLAVLLVMGAAGIIYWYKKRLAADTGNKLIPNITSFIDVLGKWFAGWVAISSLLIVLIISLFRADQLLGALGLERLADSFGWNLAFMGLVRGLLIVIVTRIILYLISVRWVIWNFIWQKIILRFTAWSGGFIRKFSLEQGARNVICFISIVLLIMGVCLVHKGVNDPVMKKMVSEVSSKVSSVSMDKISGGNIPDALTGTDSQMDFKGANRNTAFDDDSLQNINDAEFMNVSLPGTNHLIYTGLISILLSLTALGFLIVRKNQQQYQ